LALLVLRTGRLVLAAPARWRLPHWICSFALASAVALACVYRLSLQLQIEGRGGLVPGAVASFANIAGSGTAVAMLGIGALVLGVAVRKDDVVTATLVLAAAGFWAFLLVRAGQFALAEQRPMYGGAMRYFARGGYGISGHAAATALLVLPVREVLLCRRTPLTRNVVTVALLTWTAVVGWSRVWMGMHYAWSTLAGAALGFWASAAAVAAWRASSDSGAGGTRASSGT
jgi:membrane-associated phospholipid phosphatase